MLDYTGVRNWTRLILGREYSHGMYNIGRNAFGNNYVKTNEDTVLPIYCQRQKMFAWNCGAVVEIGQFSLLLVAISSERLKIRLKLS